MDAKRWPEVRRRFEAMLDLDQAQRLAELALISDTDTRRDVQHLLARHDEEADWVDRPAAQLIGPALAGGLHERDWDREQIGRRVSAYQLEDLIGAGGMGTVYRARRIEGGFEQIVAIKLVLSAHPGLHGRFRQEQEILAGLRHPNIAQLIDGGETVDGIPFLAMEYVDGVPVTEYCRDHLPDIAGRLRLLTQIAAALSHAHRNLVIHRDIKPSNILVTHTDARPKLLDFGIAKLLGEDQHRGLTQQQFGPMTPAFAAPEQFRGERVTVATDVYQFGVLMYRLLVGRLPYAANADDPIGWGRAVLEQSPIGLAQSLLSTRRDAAAGGVDDAVRNAPRELGRDLDAILRTALAKEPQHRYGSMDALIADIDAYLDGRPVHARHGGTLYQFSRFVARHRWSVTLGSLAIMGLMALTVLSWVQYRRARLDAERTRLSAQFMDEVLRAADPLNGKGGKGTAMELLDIAAEAMDRRLASHPELRNPTALLIANAYTNMGQIARAFPLYEKAIDEIRRDPLDPLSQAYAFERAAHAAQRNGQLERSLAWLTELEPLLVGDSFEIIRIRDGMFHTQWLIARDAGASEQALQSAQRSLDILQPYQDRLGDRWHAALARRGTCLTDLGRFEEGGRDLRAAYALALERFGPEHGRTLISRMTLGWHYTAAGDPARGLAELEPVADAVVRVYGTRSQAYGQNLHNRGNAYLGLGQIDRAIEAYSGAADAYRGSTSARAPQVGWALINVGGLQLQQGRLEEARSTYREVETIWTHSLAKDAPIRADLNFTLGLIELRLGNPQSALAYGERAIVMYRQRPQGTLETARALALVAEIKQALSLHQEAVDLYDQAIALLERMETTGSDPELAAQKADWVNQRLKLSSR
jgi:eukaryotic-like serine/threonine-protein kinase